MGVTWYTVHYISHVIFFLKYKFYIAQLTILISQKEAYGLLEKIERSVTCIESGRWTPSLVLMQFTEKTLLYKVPFFQKDKIICQILTVFELWNILMLSHWDF